MCKITHWVKNYSLCVKSHTVCEITHILQDSTGVPFALDMEKIPLTLTFLHQRRWWRWRQIPGMIQHDPAFPHLIPKGKSLT